MASHSVVEIRKIPTGVSAQPTFFPAEETPACLSGNDVRVRK